MRCFTLRRWLLIGTCVLLAPTLALPALAVDLKLIYSTNAASQRLVQTFPQAKAAIEKAASDLSSLLTGQLLPINTPEGIISGQQGNTRTNLDWNWTYLDPTSDAVRELPGIELAANEVRVYVGSQMYNGATHAGGNAVAGSGGFGSLRVGLSGEGSVNELGSALAKAEQNSNAMLQRGGEGPELDRLVYNDVFQIGPTGPGLEVSFGLAVGSLSFDSDTNNDGAPDTDAQWQQFWHLDHTTVVAPGKMDLYTTALHEMIHVLGLGRSRTWRDQVRGTEWLGPAARQANGNSGAGLIASDGVHLASGLQSPSITNGVAQEPLMSNSIVLGARKFLTQLDAAILKDLGWTVTLPQAAVAGDFNGDRLLTIADLDALTAALGTPSTTFDVNRDQKVSPADRVYWVTQLKRSWVGDANLDRLFDTTDLLLVFQAGTFETTRDAGWNEGDWDGDRRFGTGDLILAFQDAGFERGLRASVPVPEPSGILLVSLFTVAMAARVGSQKRASDLS